MFINLVSLKGTKLDWVIIVLVFYLFIPFILVCLSLIIVKLHVLLN
jgi:hypothetical protein